MTCFSDKDDDEVSDTDMPVLQGKDYSLQCALLSHTERGPFTINCLIQLATDLFSAYWYIRMPNPFTIYHIT